jgi:zinc protease
MSRILMFTVVAALISCSSTVEKPKNHLAEELNINLHEKSLDNGLKVILIKNDKLPVFTFYTFFQVGSKFETKGITGATHFLEHMMFKGAKKYGPGEFDKLVEGNGGKNNAYTSSDLTVYYESLPKEHLETMIDIEADRMQNLLLEEKGFNSEKQVVLEERKMRYENSDDGKLYMKMMETVFEGTPYEVSPIGSIADIKNVTRDQVWSYFKKFYAPNNAIIVISGDIDIDETFKMIESRYKDIPKSEGLESHKDDIVSNKGFDFKAKFNDRNISLRGTSRVPKFMYAFKGIKIGERRGFALDILSSVLGDGNSSYLTQKLVYGKKPWLESIYAANYTLQDNGVFFLGGQLLPKKNIWSSKFELRKFLKKACNEAITERAIQKVKNTYLASMFNSLDTNDGVAKFVGNRAVYFNDPNFYKKEIEIYNSISVDEVKNVCREYLQPKNAVFISIWNKHPRS